MGSIIFILTIVSALTITVSFIGFSSLGAATIGSDVGINAPMPFPSPNLEAAFFAGTGFTSFISFVSFAAAFTVSFVAGFTSLVADLVTVFVVAFLFEVFAVALVAVVDLVVVFVTAFLVDLVAIVI